MTLDYGGAILGQSDAGWAACDSCAALVINRDRHGLAERALKVNPLNVPGEMEMQLWAHGLFFEHWRRSPPTRILNDTQS